ncbi:pentatricopeptide repeat-containing protein At2g30780-like [Impatiens glandulifera]|uniref:pentatricopeptide repeat-containing protein At2g30780-like n=1 Tax=Impatiens glandulifera TaxID=253017 RepID=UPI001FB1195F|nr:pentatricopeptide repeat-containing protein At2g30780-like [Impatiens glandulifera]
MMKRVWSISELARPKLLLRPQWWWRRNPETLDDPFSKLPTTINNKTSTRDLTTPSISCWDQFPDIIRLFSNSNNTVSDDLNNSITGLSQDLIAKHLLEEEGIERILEAQGLPLFSKYSHLSAFLELLKKLSPRPQVAVQVFNWRRKQVDCSFPMLAEEYAKAIAFAGKLKNIDLALELFNEAGNKNLKRISTYNALMGVYMLNGCADKCHQVFQDIKRDINCCPSVVTYNILISVFGRSLLVDHMEATFAEMQRLNISPTSVTYNNLIAGYLTAWLWEDMEKTYESMKESSVNPDDNTYLLLLRGYAHSGNLEKMENMYELVSNDVNKHYPQLIRAMVCAYCKSCDKNRVQKVEVLLRFIPEGDYRPWLNVLLIRLYAQEDMFEEMEKSINEAFDNNISVGTVDVMRCIISSYFRRDKVDNLSCFVKRAERAGWRICRSLYHCKMVMYGSQKRLKEMERVLDELEDSNIHLTKKTFWILYNAYNFSGKTHKLKQVLGLMCKNGYDVPLDAFPS